MFVVLSFGGILSVFPKRNLTVGKLLQQHSADDVDDANWLTTYGK